MTDDTKTSARNVVTNVRFAVEIFDGTGHFGMWKSEVLDVLFQQGLNIAIEGEKPDDVEEKEWKRINRLACGTIRSCLSREQKYAFFKETSANKLWKALEEKFLKKSGQNKLYMKKRLFRFNYVPGTTMNDHITSFNQLVTDLMNMDVTFEDEDLALMLMGSLPDDYELRKKEKQENTSVEAEALVVRGRQKSQNKGRRGRSKLKSRLSKDECVFCREKRNWKKECPRLKNKGKPERGKAVSESNMVEYDDADSDFKFAATPSTSCSSSWLLDSACSHHMTPNREWFFDFKELKDVHYVPDLMRNLISVGTLESKGLEVRAKDGIMRIISGALVIMKGIRKRNNVYYFMGSTIVGTAGARACKLAFCEHCIKGKNKMVKFGTAIHDTKGILDYVHSDVWGPSKTTSLGGTHYYVTFVDDFSRRVWVYTMKTKDENGVAERMNRTLVEKVRCILSNAGLGKEFWVEALVYACHLVNRLPSTAIGGKTPLEIWFGEPAIDYDSLHVFGSTVYYHVKESKLDPRAKKAIFIGITSGVKGYRLWCPETKKIIFSRDVTFDESTMLRKVTSEKLEQTDGTPKQVEFEGSRIVPASKENDVDSPMVEEESDEEEWRIAMNEEMQSLQKNQMWKLASLLKGNKAIGCKWVYAKKDGFPDKNNIRYKERLVAKGYAQTEGVDYNEVFSPVVKHFSIIILLALVAQLDLELVQMDVKTAFLNGDLDEEIYMTQPDGFKVAEKEEMVCKLEKSLYGLKQSPRQWEFEMKDFGEAKKILGMKISRDKKLGRLCLSQKEYLRKVLKRFGMNEKSKPVSTPLAPHFKLDASMSPKDDVEREYMSKVPYASVVGSLMYAMVCTRPDISQTVGVVSRYMHDPGKEHWQAVKWILRYILNTIDVGLIFQQDRQDGQCVVGYCDSDYAGDLDKRRSTTGYVFTFAKAPVSWKSTLQSTVALSTTEAEYMAVTEAMKEAIWFQGLLGELGMEQKHIKVHCDSQSAIHLAKNQGYEPFVSHEGLEKLHRFIFVMAITHLAYSCLTMLLAIVKIHRWRAWEEEAHTDQHGFLTAQAKEALMRRQTAIVVHHKANPLATNRVVIWLVDMLLPAIRVVSRSSDYLTLRKWFIMNHNLSPKHDFHNCMVRSMEEEFQMIALTVFLGDYLLMNRVKKNERTQEF
ncbi:hypothetical protein F3Y22_tig00110926pilonHSYRG00104 [Hibiscus syriacus]|uniref:Integrase catalytic domain-containing protein n=1 Tax=Hibiscus syriacus TaxID=106335 RepID=A0A6A2ZDM8_HIBSY|nr:hypothetical protein F3Y22_tig00110926pilonHSYRG00104 [Hibiscus syriacus]